MNQLFRNLRIVDPAWGVDLCDQDLWVRDGRIQAWGNNINAPGAEVIILPANHHWVVSPPFIDLHVHLRIPGDSESEDLSSGAAAAVAGGFTTVLQMANTRPPIDSAAAVETAVRLAQGSPIDLLVTAALSRALEGRELVDLSACAAAGAAAFSDDGRNTFSAALLQQALMRTDLPILVHPEAEEIIAGANPPSTPVATCVLRPRRAEVEAVTRALNALRAAQRGRLHLQHISTAESVDLIHEAQSEGLPVTAEVTPHHLTLTRDSVRPGRAGDFKMNPPLRDSADCLALLQGLREGVIGAIATDHAPHAAAKKSVPLDQAAPGVIGLETALRACLSLPGFADVNLPLLLERLTAGPRRILGMRAQEPLLRTDIPANLVLFGSDGSEEVTADSVRSKSANTPYLEAKLPGKILLVIHKGAVVFEEQGAKTVAHV